MTVQLVTAGLFLANAIPRWRDLYVTATSGSPLLLSVCGVLRLWLGNLFGGELVFQHGRRVDLAPSPAAERPTRRSRTDSDACTPRSPAAPPR